jgi:hypothetical protein
MKGLFGQKAGAQFRFNLRTFLAAWCFLILSPAAHAKPVLKLLTYDGLKRSVAARFRFKLLETPARLFLGFSLRKRKTNG